MLRRVPDEGFLTLGDALDNGQFGQARARLAAQLVGEEAFGLLQENTVENAERLSGDGVENI